MCSGFTVKVSAATDVHIDPAITSDQTECVAVKVRHRTKTVTFPVTDPDVLRQLSLIFEYHADHLRDRHDNPDSHERDSHPDRPSPAPGGDR